MFSNEEKDSPAGLVLARDKAVPNVIRNKLQAGTLAHAFSIKMTSNIAIVQFAATAQCDAILVDLEHSSADLYTANQLSIAALAAGTAFSWIQVDSSITPIVRVPENTSSWISRCLDGGAQAVIVPHVNSAEEAKNVVRYARFAPQGERSATSSMPAFRYADVPSKFANIVANEHVTVICMIETELALARADEIAAVQGVDVLLIGSADLTQDMGIPGEYDSPRLMEAYATVAAAAEKVSVNGRLLSIGIGGINARPDLIEAIARKHANARFVMSGADNSILFAGMKKTCAGFVQMTKRISESSSGS